MAGRFPDTFWWGTAASSPQTEGAAPASDWSGYVSTTHNYTAAQVEQKQRFVVPTVTGEEKISPAAT